MIIAQAIVERGLLDTLVDGFLTILDRADYYIGAGNTKWALIALAVLMAFVFFKPSRR
jgi:hypothetical protein